jgi:hypothetical protein
MTEAMEEVVGDSRGDCKRSQRAGGSGKTTSSFCCSVLTHKCFGDVLLSEVAACGRTT